MPSPNSTDENAGLARLRALLSERNLLIRLVSALVLVPMTLLAIWIGGIWFLGYIAGVVLLAGREWLRMIVPDMRIGVMAPLLAVLLTALLICGQAPDMVLSAVAVIGASAVFLCISLLLGYRDGVAVTLGVPYILVPAVAILWLRAEPQGLQYIIYLFFVVWATDTGAYFAGRLLGGPKLAPLISPKKTWSGAIGGTMAAGFIGLLVSLYFQSGTPGVALSLACFLAVVSQFGDLLESAIKRRYALKDTGGIIPGHGGVLDRVDGLLAAAVGLAVFHALLLVIQVSWW